MNSVENSVFFAGVEGGGTCSKLMVFNENGQLLANAETGSTNPYVNIEYFLV